MELRPCDEHPTRRATSKKYNVPIFHRGMRSPPTNKIFRSCTETRENRGWEALYDLRQLCDRLRHGRWTRLSLKEEAAPRALSIGTFIASTATCYATSVAFPTSNSCLQPKSHAFANTPRKNGSLHPYSAFMGLISAFNSAVLFSFCANSR